MSHLAKCLTLLFLVAVVSTLPSGMAIAQHRDAGRFVTYVPVAGANSMDGIEYRDDNVKAGRIFVSPELLADLPFEFLMEEKRGSYVHTVSAIRADFSVDGRTYELAGYYRGEEMSFQSALQNYKDRAAAIDAVKTAMTEGKSVTITLVDLQAGGTKIIHQGVFVAQSLSRLGKSGTQ